MTPPLPESGWEESAFDGSPDPSVVEESVDDLDMFVRIRRPVIRPQRGWFL